MNKIRRSKWLFALLAGVACLLTVTIGLKGGATLLDNGNGGMLKRSAGIILISLVSEDFACLLAGSFAAAGSLSLTAAVAASMAGLFIGDGLVFLAGSIAGGALNETGLLRWFLRGGSLDRARSWFSERGPGIVFLCRFVPGTRLPVYLIAGALKLQISKFARYTFLGIVIWTPPLVYVSSKAGPLFAARFASIKVGAGISIVLIGALILAFRWLAGQLATRRTRAIWTGKFRRLVQWEFWPTWVAYLPVAFYLVILSVRYRSFSLFTAANPAIPNGGITGESKAAILHGLGRGNEFVARFDLLAGSDTAEERLERSIEFIRRNGLSLPIVMKPDAGERGRGVRIIRSREALEEYLEEFRGEVIIQEYVPGFEFGIFYYRLPGEPCGTISSITEKRFPKVTGDGVSTVEELVLADARAVCTFDALQVELGSRMSAIPALGEQVVVAELGSHCRGAIFLDGSGLRTKELETRIDEISKGYDGFYFGRYDIRCESREDMSLGRDFKIIELNGVTAEAAHVYDPRVSLKDAYKTWFQHWQVAFEIGKRNVLSGGKPAGLRDLLKLTSGRPVVLKTRSV